MKLAFSNLILGLLSASVLTACSKKSKNPEDFSSFAANISIAETETCTSYCVSLKKEFRYLAYTGKNIYAYWNEKQAEFGIDFEKKAVEFENQITNDTTEYQYYVLLSKWAALFHDGHVNAMLSEQSADIEFYDTPVRYELLAPATDHETLIVSRVGSGLNNIKVGMVVDKINDQDWKTLLAEAEVYSTGSTAQMRRRQAANYIQRLLLEREGPVPFKLEGRVRGQTISEVIPRNISLNDSAALPNEPEDTGIDYVKAMILSKNIGYLRIDAFAGTKMRSLLTQAMDKLSRTNGLIIDVRKNGGGDLSGDIILSRLTSSKIVRFQQRAVFSDMLQALRPSNLFDYDYISGAFTEMKSRFVKPSSDERYAKPVVVLSSAYCFSACDTFVSALKENKLALVLGEATGGGTGNPVTIELPASGHEFRYSVAQGFTASGTMLEGVGTSPDVVIEPTVEERVSSQDLQLEKAAGFLSSVLDGDLNAAQTFVLNPALKEVKPQDVIKIPYDIEIDREIKKNHD